MFLVSKWNISTKTKESVYFMDQRSYNQYTLALSIVGDVANFHEEGNTYYVYMYDDKPLTIETTKLSKIQDY